MIADAHESSSIGPPFATCSITRKPGRAIVICRKTVLRYVEGSKIRGGYALIRMQTRDRDEGNWLLIKLRDEHVGALPGDLEEQPESVTTGRTVEDLGRSAGSRKPGTVRKRGR